MREMFAKIAPRYDFLNRIMSLGLDFSWRRRAVKNADFKEGAVILDLGTGTGDMAQAVFQHKKHCKVVGYDNCYELMEIGRSKIEDRSIYWIMGDGRRLPFQDDSFDGIVAAFSLRNMADLDHVFSEMYRVLKPAGKTLFLDMVKPAGFLYQTIFKLHFKYIVPRLGRLLGSDPDAYSYLFPSIENFYTSLELQEKMKQFGFQNIYAKNLMFRTVTICIGLKCNGSPI